MKTIYFFLITFFFLGFNLNARTVTVDTVDEFLAAIASDTTIKLKGSTIYLSNASSFDRSDNYYFWEQHDGYELVINGVKNLKIIGLGNRPVKIITKPNYGNVLAFEDCENITIENVDAGHGPEKGFCTGGVFYFKDSKNITINKSIMFGSGIEGITAEGVSGMKVNDSIIRGCTYSIMTIYDSKNIEFNNCEFYDNEKFDLVNIQSSENITYNSSVFINNRAKAGDYSYNTFFNVSDSKNIVLNRCTVENNLAGQLSINKDDIKLIDSQLINNDFQKMYKD